MEYKIVKYFNRNFRFLDRPSNIICSYSFLIFLWLAIMAAVYFLDYPNRRAIIAGMNIALLLHFFIDEGLLKHAFSSVFFRCRPYIAHPEEIKSIGYSLRDSSFPSSHLATALAVFTVIFHFHPDFWPAMAVFAVLLAFARLRNGMHYPTDILAGAALGIGYASMALFAIRHSNIFY